MKLFDVFSKGCATKGRATPAECGSKTKGVAGEIKQGLTRLYLVQAASATAPCSTLGSVSGAGALERAIELSGG